MNVRGTIAAALAAVLLGAAPRPLPLTVYSAPAGTRPAGAAPGHPADAILPDGRSAAPLGQSLLIGTNPQSVCVSPDGRYAIVVNDWQGAPPMPAAGSADVAAGYTLAVVDTRTMRIASIYHASPVEFFVGVASVRDPANSSRILVLAADGASNSVRIFDLSADGTLSLEQPSITLTGASSDANGGRVYPASIAVSDDSRIVYVTGQLGGTVSAIDVGARRLLHSVSTGYFPFGVAVDAAHAYVTNNGLSQYHSVGPARSPRFAEPASDPYKSSSLAVVPLVSGGDVQSDPAAIGMVRMDPVPDGVTTVGGAKPGSIVTRRDGRYAYVAMENVDRIATVELGAQPHVVAGLDLRLFVNAPYGTEPDAEVLSNDGKRLYVALAGINGVAVLDARNPAQLHRLGLIPTAWAPSALTISPDGRYLYVTNAKGVDGWGVLQRVDLKTLSLAKTTLSALRYNRSVRPAQANDAVPPLRSNRKSNVIDRIVCISVGDATFDAMLGDLGGHPELAEYGETVTPNLHALARTYGLADNFYANDMLIDANRQFALSGVTTAYASRTLPVNAGRSPLDEHGVDPEDYSRAGYLFNALSRASLTYRNYGGLLWLSGYRDTSAQQPARGRGAAAGPAGNYTLDVPALASLNGHVDLDYPGWNPAISDMRRAQSFIDDMEPLVRTDTQPAFTYAWLPTVPGRDGVADADRGLGMMIEYLSRTTHWSSTAVFIVPDGIETGRDHVNVARSYALVVSPLAKRAYVGHNHLSVASVLKTEEELLGLPPLALSDLLATDLADFFGDVPYPAPYQAIK